MAVSMTISRSISEERAVIRKRDIGPDRDTGNKRRRFGESDTHRRLKELAFLWAYDRGYRCCAMEVQAPRSSYRVDVAGIRIDRNSAVSTVAVFECKQSRDDLLRDNRRRDQLRKSLAQHQERREKLESLLAVHYPSLRTSDSLFPEWATFDFTTLDHRGYRQTIQKIVQVQRQVLNEIKFDRVTHYQLGNLHYLVVPAGMVQPAEVPIGWGLLEVEPAGRINENILPTRFKQGGSSEWLIRIARASTNRQVSAIEPNQTGVSFRQTPGNL
jgi:hypothetical protein